VGRVVNGDIVAPDLKPEYGIFRFAAVSILGRLNLSHYGVDCLPSVVVRKKMTAVRVFFGSGVYRLERYKSLLNLH
jgi:hypothetical protein